jgi:hypothetical protein
MNDRPPPPFPGIKALRKKFPEGELIRLALCDEEGGTIVFEGRLPEDAKPHVGALLARVLGSKKV